MLELIEQFKLTVDELLDVLGRASIEAVLPALASRRKGSPGHRIRGRRAERLAGMLITMPTLQCQFESCTIRVDEVVPA